VNIQKEEVIIQPMNELVRYGGLEAYSAKVVTYFNGARQDYVGALPPNAEARILEVGCGEGATGALALGQGKCGVYCGVELCERAANIAKGRISAVVTGNIEDQELPWPSDWFDALILSEVLEHLVDPWSVLRKLRPLLKPNALVFASSPNVSHHKVIRMLMRGEWNLGDAGLMDRTHLRWFTPKAYRDMFQACGYIVDSVGEKERPSRKARIASFITLGRYRHLFVGQIDLRGHRSL